MSRVPAISLPLLPRSRARKLPWRGQRGWLLAALTASCAVAALLIGSPPMHRLLLAACIALNLMVIAVRSPKTAVYLTLIYLPLMAMIRRLMISDVPWTSQDPLVLVVPAVVAFICAQLFLIERRGVLRDSASTLAAALAVIAFIEVGNPRGGGIKVGLGGLLFIAVPLGWFFIGRELLDRALVRKICTTVALLGIAIAVYGLAQTEIGFPFWDQNWMNSVTFDVLNVGTSTSGSAIRAFGPFSSPSEYLYWLGATIVFCVAAFYERKSPLILMAPLVAVALFLGSGRSTLILSTLAISVMTVLRLFRGRRALLLVLVGFAVTIGALVVLGPLLARAGAGSGNPLVAHEAGGLGNPLDESSSSLPAHFRAVKFGIESGIRNPLGLGTGGASFAADTLGSSDSGPAKTTVDHNGEQESLRGTDADLSNVFLSLGAAGGFTYLALLIVLARRILRRYSLWRDPVLLAVMGFSVLLTGQWIRGEQYAISALTWVLLGWATRSQDDPRLEDGTRAPAVAVT